MTTTTYITLYIVLSAVFAGASVYYFMLPKMPAETPDKNQAGPNEI